MNIQIESYNLEVPISGAFLDIGCCDGLYTDALYRHVDKVHAFEANPTSYKDLVRKYADIDSINIVQALVGEGIGQKQFFPHPTNKACSTAYVCDTVEYGSPVTLDSISIDSLSIDDVSVVKIDVEGCEAEVIKGMIETIEKYHPILLIEIHDHMNPGHIPYIQNVLEDFDYSVEYCFIDAYLRMGVVGPFTGPELHKRHFYITAK